MVEIIAHRGAGNIAPENILAAQTLEIIKKTGIPVRVTISLIAGES